MNYHDNLRFGVLYKFYLMYLHPLFELHFKWDPSFSRFARFSLLYFRIMLCMLISFAGLKRLSPYDTNAGLVIGYMIALSLLFIPLPDCLIGCFRNKFYLLRNVKEVSED